MTQTRIATGGKAGAGKDFVLNILTQYHAGHSLRPIVIGGFGLLVRLDYYRFFGRYGEREDWQNWGQIRRGQDEEYWLKAAIQWADDQPMNAVIGFSGVRFPNEVRFLQGHDFKVGLVRAPKEVRVQRLLRRDGYLWSDEKLEHSTEIALDKIPVSAWDFIVNNG